MRLSRKVLTGLASVAAITVAGALIWALYQGNKKSGGGPELYNTENKTAPDGLSALPRDYAGVAPPPAGSGIPPLGPPLPGDIGRPVPGAQGPSPGAVDAEVFAQEHGQRVEPVKLVPSMLARFMSADRAFVRARRAKTEMG
jgi:type IV secretion system protein VirB10